MEFRAETGFSVEALHMPASAGIRRDIMVTRVFVEKKKGFDIEAAHLRDDLVENLGITGLQELRLLNRYDVCGLTGPSV